MTRLEIASIVPLVLTPLLSCANATLAQQPPLQAITLSDAAERALAHHPVMAAADARADAAAAAAGVARAARLPSLRSEASAIRFQEPMIVAPLHRFDPQNVPPFDRTLIQGNVVAQWTLFDGGARGARIRQADALEDVALAQRASAERALVAATASAWLDARLAGDLLAAYEAQRDALQAERRRVSQLFEEGKVARVELLRIDAALARAEAEAAAALAERDVALADLQRYTGVPVAPAPADIAVPGAPALDEITARAVESSADVRAARARAAAAAAAHAQSRAGWLPRVDLAGRYNEYGSGAGDVSWEWQGGVQLSWALFTGGARAREAERTAAEARAASADAEAIARDVEHQVDRAAAALTGALARVRALEAALEQQQEVVRVELLALREGAGVQTDYLNAEAELLRMRAALTEARHAALLSRIEIARITGALSPAWLENALERGQ
ncbi:MAG: TolC family protein [Candidatus Cloacimonetes bacterium]|nr:TolC family protein [Candidatus Cloacimonadota bacterium]